jgi:hypothetical protein
MRRLSRGLPRVGRGFVSNANVRVNVVVIISVYMNAHELESVGRRQVLRVLCLDQDDTDYFCSFRSSREMRYSFAAPS